MIPELGQMALAFALMVSLALGILGMAGPQWRIPLWCRMARPLTLTLFVLMMAAFTSLTVSFVVNDFSVAYVAQNSNSAVPLYYRVTAVWGGHEGSMLLWVLILSLFVPGGGPAAGWTLYPPLVIQTGSSLPMAIFDCRS